jgi:tRNA (guanine37-N1)-methyltransferase
VLCINFVTLFPEMVLGAVGHSILKRAEAAGLVRFHAVNPREFATDKHRKVDDSPFGGGPGMVLKPEPIDAALRSLLGEPGACVVVPDPTGSVFTQADAAALAREHTIVFLCGHYEGIDERVVQKWATHRLSIGDYILTGGELPALVMADAVCRLVPGVLGSAESLDIDSHSQGLLSAPQYTRPELWDGQPVPEVLRSGDHGKVALWRRWHALHLTRTRRPDLFARADLAKSDVDLLQSQLPPSTGDLKRPEGSDR